MRISEHVPSSGRLFAESTEDFKDFGIHRDFTIFAALRPCQNQDSSRQVHSLPTETKLFAKPHSSSQRYLYHRLQMCPWPFKSGHQRWLFFRQEVTISFVVQRIL